ncbi:MAG: hypothetical protein ACO2PN_20700 [Pyrobaculum sp.]|jgi:hypothetical protein
MTKKLKEDINTLPEASQTVKELTNEEKELLQSALRLVIAKRRQNSLAVTLVTLVKHVQLLLPFSADTKTIIEYIRTELAKSCKLITLHDRIGKDVLSIETVLLYNTTDELIEEFQKKKIDTIKIVDAELDCVSDYLQ